WLAPAKINLWLRITGVREDGFHELDTAFAFLNFGDALAFAPHPTIEVEADRGPSGEANLVHRVLAAFAAEVGAKEGLWVRIRKRIPIGGGLGGGSSDAAAALLAANRLWGAHWPREALIEWAVRFGADIPCFLFGHAARAGGIGERLSPIRPPRGWVLVAHAGEMLDTGAVFASWDAMYRKGQAALKTPAAPDSLPLGENALEAAACACSPRLASLLSAMRARGWQAWMTGSGACCVAWFATREEAQRAEAELGDVAAWAKVARVEALHPQHQWAIGA
ncbi:MAG: 4-(cytidine 5'-diphospho)-2-C-methyl-D-erythritol kinase, partial [Zetaproteobacteria bacterium]